MNELTTIEPQRPLDAYRMSTDAAGVCREIVVATASTIQGRKFVSVEGWQAIALAHGCVAGSRDVERIDGGVRAIGEVRRMSDGGLIATAEGFVGEDETTWFGGKDKRGKVHDKRNDYAIRAMAQTRAISRACRSAFAHVVVMMKANLETTPAAEVPAEGFDQGDIIETSSGPAPRTKLDGPYTSKTALKTAIHSVASAVLKAKSADEISKAVKAGKSAIDQAERDWPELLTGDPQLEGDDEGLKRLVARRRAEVTQPEPKESLTFQLLCSTLDEVATPDAYKEWLDKHGRTIGELDGEESRAFEEIHDLKYSVLSAMAETHHAEREAETAK